MAVGKDIKRERRSNITFPLILLLLGRISSWVKGKKTKISKHKSGEEFSLSGTLYTPVHRLSLATGREISSSGDLKVAS